jgi:hypothetical protein
MPRKSLVPIILRVDQLASEMQRFVPIGTRGADSFRADLAGLLVVAIAASYEDCVKITLVEHAAKRHVDFEEFSERNFSKLSSRIKINDLHSYSKLFGEHTELRFKEFLKRNNSSIKGKTGINIESSYKQLLDWRHDYAHGGIKHTTIDEAMRFHRFGVRVIFSFNKAFDC